MPGPAFLHGDRLTLRTVEPEDYEFVHQHWSTPQIRRNTSQYIPRTHQDITALFENSDDTAVYFLPCRNNEPVGLIWLFDIEDTLGRAEVGYWIIEDEQGNGYATESVELTVNYAFNDRGLRKISARVFEGNEASRNVLRKVGFEEEGQLRDHYYVDGEYIDAYLYALFSEAD